jgi:antitoxin (DNA-binding transcriptional repressor) of toxin-antitoxin stability system
VQVRSANLRFKTRQIFEALEQGEGVGFLHSGRMLGRLVPLAKPKIRALNHPSFGMEKKDKRSVHKIIPDLRKPRYGSRAGSGSTYA